MTYVFYAIAAYVVFVWIGLRLVVPHLGFRKSPLPEQLPSDIELALERMNAEAVDDHDFLKRAYAFVTGHFRGGRLQTVTNFWVAFYDPLTAPPGFMPCTGQNYLLRTLLIKSGRFTEDDIEVHTIPLNLFIHQYLRIHIGTHHIDADPWSSFLGVPLGKKSAFIG